MIKRNYGNINSVKQACLNPGGCEIFRTARPDLGPTQSPVPWVPGLSLE
jgi:hypothetical protein